MIAVEVDVKAVHRLSQPAGSNFHLEAKRAEYEDWLVLLEDDVEVRIPARLETIGGWLRRTLHNFYNSWKMS